MEATEYGDWFLLQQPARLVPGPRRVALYSHDTQGLGHIRRNLALAWSLSRLQPTPDVLLIFGAREARAFPLPPQADSVTLPALRKDRGGGYEPRALRAHVRELLTLRGATIRAALDAFDPDVFIVDKVARGALGELEPVLKTMRARGRSRMVLGLRDVLDEPVTAKREWEATGTSEAIRELYDAVWVYGDPTVYDLVVEYGLPADVARKITYTGFLGRGRPGNPHGDDADPSLPPGEFVLCMVGGGQDGFAVAQAFLRAEVPAGLDAVVITGPFMAVAERHALQRLARQRPGRSVLSFVEDAGPALRRAAAVVSMGGYNSVCELLANDKRALIVPRVRPRAEQLIRAERLHRLGLVDLLHPDACDPGAIGDWLAQPPRRARKATVDLGGLARIPGLLSMLLDSVPEPAFP